MVDSEAHSNVRPTGLTQRPGSGQEHACWCSWKGGLQLARGKWSEMSQTGFGHLGLVGILKGAALQQLPSPRSPARGLVGPGDPQG